MENETHAPMDFRALTMVWLTLLFLTALLVALSRVSPWWATAALLTVTPLKAGLVMFHFMNLKQEGPLIKGMVAVALSTLIIFIGMMFLDISFR